MGVFTTLFRVIARFEGGAQKWAVGVQIYWQGVRNLTLFGEDTIRSPYCSIMEQWLMFTRVTILYHRRKGG